MREPSVATVTALYNTSIILRSTSLESCMKTLYFERWNYLPLTQECCTSVNTERNYVHKMKYLLNQIIPLFIFFTLIPQ